MNREKHDKIIAKLLRIGKKNKVLRYLMLICIFFELAFYYLTIKMQKNVYRLTSFAALLCVFIICSSFSLADKTQENGQTVSGQYMEMVNVETVSYNAVYAQPQNVPDEDFVLEDADVIEATDEAEFEAVSDEELFSADELLEENEERLSSDMSSDVSSQDGEIELSAFHADDWNLILINKQHPVPDDYEFNLGEITAGMECDERIVDSLLSMLQGAKEDGINLVICSPYRDYNRQQVLFNRKIDAYMSMGYSYTEAYQKTSQAVTVPGASEHQIGLALDIISDRYSSLNEGFADTDAGRWLNEHSWEYGFILRYPAGKEDITGIEYEPWHFRYVGRDAAYYMTMNGITLEEFVDLIDE